MNVLLICLTVALHSKALLAKFYPLSNDLQQQQQTDGDCVYKPNMGSIIKTNESIADRAVFLQFHEGQTKEGCLEKCCSLSDCNLAVHEKKGVYSCYLFNCGTEEKSRCHFSHHEDYMTMELSPRPVSHKSKSTKASQDKHENELEGLTGKKDPIETKTATTTSKSTTSPNLPTTQSTLNDNTGEVFGECTKEGYCNDEKAQCHEGVCICEHGYDFTNKHCKDLTPKGKSKSTGHHKEPYYPKVVSENEDGPPVEQPHVEEKPETTRRPTTTESATTTTKPTVTATVNTLNVTSSTTVSPATTHKQTSATAKTNSTDRHTTKTISGGGQGLEVEQIIIASPTDSAQGPIVALALGLAFTVMLLLFVGCRLRTVKRRIRKGRPLHSNEADYLINGMYL